MSKDLFSQTVIAVVWDFDKTLIPDYMQAPLFRHFGIDGKTFWQEVNALPEFYQKRGAGSVAKDTIYLNHILSYVEHGLFPELTNELLRKLGAEIPFYPGIPDFFNNLKQMVQSEPKFRAHEISVEHYIVSTGLRQMILGSAVSPYVDGVWGCEFFEGSPPPGFLNINSDSLPQPGHITGVAYAVDNTSKTRAVFEINKGGNKHPEIDVNSAVKYEDRRVPFENMVYIADGPSDIPVFSVVRHNGGQVFGVYKRGEAREFEQVNLLQKQGRIESFGEADYTDGAQANMWITSAVRTIAEKIVSSRERALKEKIGRPPGHLSS